MKSTAKKTKYGVLLAIILLIAAVAASVTSLFAWFADKSKVAMPNANFSVTSDSVTLGDEIRVKRTLPTAVNPFVQNSIYFRTENGYYLEGKALSIDALSDKEEVVLTLKFKNTSAFTQFRIYFGGLTGDTVTADGVQYNVLGGLKYAFRYYDKILGETVTDETWLYDAAGGGAAPKSVMIFTGDYTRFKQDESGFVTVEVILKADFSHLQELGVSKNALAGKKFKIGTLGLDCVKKTENDG